MQEGHRTQQQKQADEPQQQAATGANELAQDAHVERAAQLPRAPRTAPIMRRNRKTSRLFAKENDFHKYSVSSLRLYVTEYFE